MSRFVAVLLVALLAGPQGLIGQSAAPTGSLPAGSRVRITREAAKPRVAIVVAHTADTLHVRWPEFSNSVPVPLADITRLEVSTGRHRNLVKGTVIGALAGGGLGALMGAASYTPCTTGCMLQPQGRAEAAAIVGVVGGMVGLVIGSLAGASSHESWKRIPIDSRQVAVSIRPRAGGAGLGVTLPF